MANYYSVLTSALDDVLEHGYDTPARISYWVTQLREAAEAAQRRPVEMEYALRASLTSVYGRLVERGGLLREHPSVAPLALDRLRPRLRAELERRIMVSAEIIQRRRSAAIQDTLRNFVGWASNIPVGGLERTRRVEQKAAIKRPLSQAPFAERNVILDQANKLSAALSEAVGTASGAIAAKWHSKFRAPGYAYREDHRSRHGHIYIIRDSWAMRQGLIRRGGPYTTDITMPAEEPFCRCSYQYLYNLGDMPFELLTFKGRRMLNQQ